VAEFTPRTCQCALCKKHGASWISDPEGKATVTFQNKELVNFYRFGHGTSDFLICKTCGVLTIATCEIKGRIRAVINITPMTETIFTAPPIQTVFDEETVESRLARREKNWTGNVIIKG